MAASWGGPNQEVAHDRNPQALSPVAADHQRQFLAMLPTITAVARKSFSDRDPEAREEHTAEVVAHALLMFARLVEQGRESLAYAAVLARYGIKRVRIGRKAATSSNVKDVGSKYSQLAKGFSVRRIDHYDPVEEEWKSIVVEDKRSGPAEIAATRIDFSAWLLTLTQRERQVATVLATGETTNATARKFHVTASRISHLRRLFKDRWENFVDERPAKECVAAT